MGPEEQHTAIKTSLSAYQEELTVGDEAPEGIRLATEYIHNHLFDDDLTVREVRQRLGLTDTAFSARFRRHHGYSPACYIRQLRVKAAKRLLQREHLLIADIAFHVGYEHYRTFARVFKRVTGQSPKGYRNQFAT